MSHCGVIVLSGLTAAGQDWLEDVIPQDCERWGNGYIVEPRYINSVLAGADTAGMSIEEA